MILREGGGTLTLKFPLCLFFQVLCNGDLAWWCTPRLFAGRMSVGFAGQVRIRLSIEQ